MVHWFITCMCVLSFFFYFIYIVHAEMLLLSNNVNDYYFVSQGKTTIPGLDDGEELLITDVSACKPASKYDDTIYQLFFLSF